MHAYIYVRIRACVRACVRAGVRACVAQTTVVFETGSVLNVLHRVCAVFLMRSLVTAPVLSYHGGIISSSIRWQVLTVPRAGAVKHSATGQAGVQSSVTSHRTVFVICFHKCTKK